jgi:hypothetical protein
MGTDLLRRPAKVLSSACSFWVHDCDFLCTLQIGALEWRSARRRNIGLVSQVLGSSLAGDHRVAYPAAKPIPSSTNTINRPNMRLLVSWTSWSPRARSPGLFCGLPGRHQGRRPPDQGQDPLPTLILDPDLTWTWTRTTAGPKVIGEIPQIDQSATVSPGSKSGSIFAVRDVD